MTFVPIILNAILMVMLAAALAYGVRLDRKLKAIRDGQLAFAQAASDMAAAADSARSGLAELRAATDEATDLLGGRIVRAREVAERLDSLVRRGEALPTSAPRQGQEGGLSALLADLQAAERTPVAKPIPPVRERPARVFSPPIDDELFEAIGARV